MQNRFLLDSNVLMALAWADHVHHGAVKGWFQNYRDRSRFYTCPTTENGFIRASSNSDVVRAEISPREAMKAMRKIKAMGDFGFIPDNISVTDLSLVDERKVESFRSVTDAYLVGLALANGAKLATLDLRMVNLVGWQMDPEEVLELIETT
jgi:hypothetical protein